MRKIFNIQLSFWLFFLFSFLLGTLDSIFPIAFLFLFILWVLGLILFFAGLYRFSNEDFIFLRIIDRLITIRTHFVGLIVPRIEIALIVLIIIICWVIGLLLMTLIFSFLQQISNWLFYTLVRIFLFELPTDW